MPNRAMGVVAVTATGYRHRAFRARQRNKKKWTRVRLRFRGSSRQSSFHAATIRAGISDGPELRNEHAFSRFCIKGSLSASDTHPQWRTL